MTGPWTVRCWPTLAFASPQGMAPGQPAGAGLAAAGAAGVAVGAAVVRAGVVGVGLAGGAAWQAVRASRRKQLAGRTPPSDLTPRLPLEPAGGQKPARRASFGWQR